MLAAVLYRESSGMIEFGNVPAALRARVGAKQVIHLGLMFKSWTVEKAIEGLVRELGSPVLEQPMSVSPPDP